jgi:hypothetical protein
VIGDEFLRVERHAHQRQGRSGGRQRLDRPSPLHWRDDSEKGVGDLFKKCGIELA